MQCCERIAPGSIEALSERTAGRVADTLLHLAKSLPPSDGQEALEQAAGDFQAYSRTRNNLLHAKPGTNGEGEARLFRDGDQWTLEEIEIVADAFTRCGIRLAAWLENASSQAGNG